MSECVQSTEYLAHRTHARWVPPSLTTFQPRASIVTSGMLGVVDAKDFKWEQEGLLQLAPPLGDPGVSFPLPKPHSHWKGQKAGPLPPAALDAPLSRKALLLTKEGGCSLSCRQAERASTWGWEEGNGNFGEGSDHSKRRWGALQILPTYRSSQSRKHGCGTIFAKLCNLIGRKAQLKYEIFPVRAHG